MSWKQSLYVIICLEMLAACVSSSAYFFGIDVTNKTIPSETRQLAEKAQAGDPIAALKLGVMYFEADGINLDIPVSETLFNIAMQGDSSVQNVATSYLKKLSSNPKLYIRSSYKKLKIIKTEQGNIDPCRQLNNYFRKYINNGK